MLGVDERRDAAGFLRLGDGVDRQGRLTRRLGAVDLHDAAFGIAAHTQRHVEQALEIADSLIRSSAIDIIVIDSVAALTPKAEIEGEMGDSKMGLQARLMSQALRKLTSSVIEPVGMTGTSFTSCEFMRMIEPLPKSFSIFSITALSTLSLSAFTCTFSAIFV